MLFTKYINESESDAIMTEEEISEGLLESDLNLALINYDTNRVKYDAEMQAIEVYKQNNCNIELCTESFEIIKEGMMDKAKNIGKRIWEALKKIIEMLKQALKNFRAKLSKTKPKEVTPKKEAEENKTKYTWTGFITDAEKYTDKIDKISLWISSVNNELRKIIRNGRDNDHTKGLTQSIADHGKGTWLYKILLDYLNKNNAPFGKIADHDNENDFIDMADTYLMTVPSGFVRISGDSIEYVQNQVYKRFDENKKILERSIKHLEGGVKMLDMMLDDAKDIFVDSDNFKWNTVAKDYGRLCRHSVDVNKRIVLVCIKRLTNCVNNMISEKEKSSSDIEEEE